MVAFAGALAAYVMGQSESRNQRHRKALSVDSFSRARLSARDSMKNNGTAQAVVADRERKDQQPSHLTDNASDILEVVLTEHEAQFEAHKIEYEKLEEQYRKLRKEASRLKEQRDDVREHLDKTDKHKDELERQQSQLQHQLTCASTRYKHIVQKTILPFAQSSGLKWNDQTAETIAVVLEPLTADALEARALRDQVRILQKEMLAKLDKVQVVSDELLAQDFRNLVSLVKTLSRTIQFAPEADIVKISGTPALLRDVAQHHWKGRARKKCLVEAWVWCVLVDLVFQSPFGVFGPDGEFMNKVWLGIFGSEHAHIWPTPTTLCETWRHTTVEQLAKLADLAAVAQGKTKPDDQYLYLELSMFEARNSVHNVILEYLKVISTATEFTQIHPVVDKAFALALQMCSQRFRLQLTYPPVGATFNKDIMCPMSDPDGEDTEDGSVAFIVHPGLTKWGDAHGKNLDHRYDIVSSLVQLEAPKPGHRNVQAYADAVKLNV